MTNETRAILEVFAAKHGLTLETEGEVGFCRPCVGYTRAGSYVDYNPIGNDHQPIAGFYDRRLRAPAEVMDDYHKHDCLAVLAHEPDEQSPPDYDAALEQLAAWVRRLDALGVEVVSYPAPVWSLAGMFGGLHWAVRVKA